MLIFSDERLVFPDNFLYFYYRNSVYQKIYVMNINQKFLRGLVVLVTLLLSAGLQAKTSAELEAEQKSMSLYGEIAIGILFVVALTLFIVWKSKHDRKEREKHLEQMRKVAAAKRRAA
jgi:hypothetical protein